ncbi:MAG: TIGR02450 family Trp-rich protein [Spirulina sp. SIO3F2]|nr:TIGR02450 family Trp-rich protein [Spirulina sp. SIO3F2]
MAKKQKFPHLLGSKWTAQQTTFGWRHFRVINRKNEGKWVFAELVSACDDSVRFWLNARQLRDRTLWQAGWQTLTELHSSDEQPDENVQIYGLEG